MYWNVIDFVLSNIFCGKTGTFLLTEDKQKYYQNGLAFKRTSKRSISLWKNCLRVDRALQAVWPDGQITFQFLTIYTNENLPISIKVCQNMITVLSNTEPTKIVKGFYNFAKVAKFWKMWSHCLYVGNVSLKTDQF